MFILPLLVALAATVYAALNPRPDSALPSAIELFTVVLALLLWGLALVKGAT